MPPVKVRIGHAGKRARTFSRRKEGLMKKARELATLCGVDVAVVCAAGPDERGAPGVWESRDGVIQRYRALPPEKRKEETHLNYVVKEEEPAGQEKAAATLDRGMSLQDEQLLGSLDAALLATAERRKALALSPEDVDGHHLRRPIACGALAPCRSDGFQSVYGYGCGGDGLVRDNGVQPLPLINAADDVMQPAPGVQYINGGVGGNQFPPQLQMPTDGNNNFAQFAWDAYQPNITVHPGYGHHQFTDGNYYVDMRCSQPQMQQVPGNLNAQVQQVPGNLNAQHNAWLSLGMCGAGESSSHAAFAPGSSAYRPPEHFAPCVGDNFSGATGIAMGSNWIDDNGNQYETQRLTADFNDPYTTQGLGLHYPSDLADGQQFGP